MEATVIDREVPKSPEVEKLNSLVVRQVERTLENADAVPEEKSEATAVWAYNMPLPGVRCYFYL